MLLSPCRWGAPRGCSMATWAAWGSSCGSCCGGSRPASRSPQSGARTVSRLGAQRGASGHNQTCGCIPPCSSGLGLLALPCCRPASQRPPPARNWARPLPPTPGCPASSHAALCCAALRWAAGYAMAVFIPISILCVMPWEMARLGMLAGATLLSGAFLLLNFRCAACPSLPLRPPSAGSCTAGSRIAVCNWLGLAPADK